MDSRVDQHTDGSLLALDHAAQVAHMGAVGVAVLDGKENLACDLLVGLMEVDAPVDAREVAETWAAVIAQTNNRSLFGTPTDFSFLPKWQLQCEMIVDLVRVALALSRTCVAPLGRAGFPASAV
jgi:hypothetical protein